MAVNAYGPLRTAREVLPRMRDRGGGRIINVTSVYDRIVSPETGAYAASKHLKATSDALRMEVGDDIDVVMIEPTWVRTGFADRARRSIRDLDRTEVYDSLYRAYLRPT